METITINPFNEERKTVGFQYDHNKTQLDVFFYSDRITQEQYKELMDLINSHLKINIKRA